MTSLVRKVLTKEVMIATMLKDYKQELSVLTEQELKQHLEMMYNLKEMTDEQWNKVFNGDLT